MAPKGKATKAPRIVYDYSGLEKDMRVKAESDGVYYAAEVVTVSKAKNRSNAPVKVHFSGYAKEYDEWVDGSRLRSKALKKEAPKEKDAKKEIPKKETPKIEIKPNTIVVVCTSAAYLKGHPTGLWMEELATPYYLFKEAGYEVVIASTRGGPIPLDENSLKGDFFTAEAKKFMHDGEAFGAMAHSVRLSAIDWKSSDIKAIFMCGGHGVEVDFVKNNLLKKAIETTYAADKVVSAVCHGPICLAQCKKPDGSPLVKDLETTGFSNSEEGAVGLTDKCVYLIEDKFKELGGIYQKGGDWSPHVVVAGKLVTGQNPQSSAECAKAVIKILA
jgi:putative intracellular protease/amidase